MSSIDATLSERGQRYGKFEDHAKAAMAIRGVLFTLLGSEKFDSLEPDQVEALIMISHKLARIVNGDPHYDDSWRDVAGYAQLVANRLAKNDAEPEPKADPKPEPKADPKVEVKVRTFMADGDEVEIPPEIRNLLRRFLDPQ